MPTFPSLKEFLSQLIVAEYVPRPDGEEWKDLIPRISIPGTIADIDQETYDYFLAVLPPKYQRGSMFAFAEGAEPLRLFWQVGDSYFCRQLTWDETKEFCRLSGTSFPYWF